MNIQISFAAAGSEGSMPGGRGYLVYFADGMCTPFWVSILPLFSNTVYRIGALFLKQVAKREILQE